MTFKEVRILLLDMIEAWEHLSSCCYKLVLLSSLTQFNAELDEAQAGIKIARRNINNLRYVDDHPYGRKRRGTKEPRDASEREEWKSWLKTQHSKNKMMASGPITSWQIDGETVETVTDFIFLGSKITVDGDCSHEIKRCCSLEEKL